MADPSRPAAAAQRTAAIGTTEMLRLAARYRSSGRLVEARVLYARVLALHPRHAEALHGIGLVAAQQGRGSEALELLRRAVAARHDFAPAHADLAAVLQAAGRSGDALAAALKAIRFGPDLAAAHMALGEVLAVRGDLDAALTSFGTAAALASEAAEPRVRQGLVCQQLGRLEEAARHLGQALEHEPQRADARYSLGTVLHGLGRLDEALVAYDRALIERPALGEALFEVGKPRHIHALLERGDPGGALVRLDAFLVRRPGRSCALALKAVVLDELGHRDRVRELVDFRRLLTARHLGSAPGFVDTATLNTALERHILEHPTLRDAPASFSVHRGRTTGELLAPPQGPIHAFEKAVRAAVDAYTAALPAGSGHPFVANRPARWRLTMWANIIEAEGFQVPHIHPSGWLSAVYYVRVPEVVNAGGRAGWIEFGEPFQDVVHRVAPETSALRPEPGLLLLFPSYFYHRTLPFHSGERRISIAFDVVPQR